MAGREAHDWNKPDYISIGSKPNRYHYTEAAVPVIAQSIYYDADNSQRNSLGEDRQGFERNYSCVGNDADAPSMVNINDMLIPAAYEGTLMACIDSK